MVIQDSRLGLRGKNDSVRPPGIHRPQCITWRDDESRANRVLRSGPAEFLLQFLIIPFDDPAMFGQVDEFHYRDIVRKRGEPVLGWLRFPRWPFDQ